MTQQGQGCKGGERATGPICRRRDALASARDGRRRVASRLDGSACSSSGARRLEPTVRTVSGHRLVRLWGRLPADATGGNPVGN
jgi:hypothetical protein